MIPRIYNHSYTISADLVIPEGGAEGVIVAAFDHLGGFALYVMDGKLKHHYSMLGVLEYTQASETPLPAGEVSVEMVFAADAPKPATGGEVTLLVNGEPVASGGWSTRCPRASRATPGWTSAATTASSSTAATPTRRRSGSRARSSRSPSTSRRT